MPNKTEVEVGGVSLEPMLMQIRTLMDEARQNTARQINSILLCTYWQIGKIIIEDEQKNSLRADYGTKLLKSLSRKLIVEYGKGFSVSNLQFMRRLYVAYEKQQTLSVKLSWSHYCELLSISDNDKRSFYERECENSCWSVRELKRQIQTSLFERLLLSSGVANKEKVLELALCGNELNTPADILKDPYVFEFLGLPENKPIMESELEKSLINHIGQFLMELGKGFMFVGSQQRITLANKHYHVDAVFYNKILRCYVLIELKTTKLYPEAVGQINAYLNYYKQEVNDEYDNEPIGIILCAEKDNVEAEYFLGGLSNQIFASRYTLVIPDKTKLIAEVNEVLEQFGKNNTNE